MTYPVEEIEQRDVDNCITDKTEEFRVSIKELQVEVGQRGGRQRMKDILLAESTLAFLVEIKT